MGAVSSCYTKCANCFVQLFLCFVLTIPLCHRTRILHIDPMWVTAGELADSMKPGAELSNTVAEIGITVLKKCCVDKKVIFPWVITSQLLNGNFDSKLVKLYLRTDVL